MQMQLNSVTLRRESVTIFSHQRISSNLSIHRRFDADVQQIPWFVTSS